LSWGLAAPLPLAIISTPFLGFFIANLIEKGANPAEISSNSWDNNTVSRLKLLSLILGRVELVKDNEVVVLWLKRNELQEFGFEKGDTDGFVNYGLSLAGVKVSAFFMEDLYEDFIKNDS